ncbi:MAG: YceI family protein [Myxococcota bacterium]
MRRTMAWMGAAGLALVLTAGMWVGSAGADTEQALTFVAKNGVSTANGTFHRWEVARASVDPADLAGGEVVVRVDLASVDTGIEDRDDHLRTPDFFDVERFPSATARLHSATPNGTNAAGEPVYAVKIDLDLHGVKKTLDGSFVVVQPDPFEVRGEVALDRLDFGIGEPDQWWNPLAIRERVDVSFHAQLP